MSEFFLHFYSGHYPQFITWQWLTVIKITLIGNQSSQTALIHLHHPVSALRRENRFFCGALDFIHSVVQIPAYSFCHRTKVNNDLAETAACLCCAYHGEIYEMNNEWVHILQIKHSSYMLCIFLNKYYRPILVMNSKIRKNTPSFYINPFKRKAYFKNFRMKH